MQRNDLITGSGHLEAVKKTKASPLCGDRRCNKGQWHNLRFERCKLDAGKVVLHIDRLPKVTGDSIFTGPPRT